MEILIIMVANESQADSVLFGNAGAVPGNLYKLTPYVLLCRINSSTKLVYC